MLLNHSILENAISNVECLTKHNFNSLDLAQIEADITPLLKSDACKNLATLNVAGIHPVRNHSLYHSIGYYCTNITKLNVSDTAATYFNVFPLSNLSGLQVLQMCNIKGPEVLSFPGPYWNSIRCLDFNHSTKIKTIPFLIQLESTLTYLDISYTSFTAFGSLLKLTNLQTLKLEGLNISKQEAIDIVSYCKKLESLCLSACRLISVKKRRPFLTHYQQKLALKQRELQEYTQLFKKAKK